MYKGIDVRVVFMGTPEFAVPSLHLLVEHAPPGLLWAGGLDLVGIITQPDRPAGRGQHPTIPPVKRFALGRGLRVYQPRSLRAPEAATLLHALAPDVIVVVAYGRILPQAILDLPQYGCLNVHASLLPRHRGAAPVAGAILAGDLETGVSIMLMDAGLDTGPILARKALTIEPDETAGMLAARLAILGASLLGATLPRWLARGIAPEAQDPAQATSTRPLRKDDGRLDWHQRAALLARAVRAYTPWPGAYTTWHGLRLKVLEAHALGRAPDLPPGACFVSGDHLACTCAQGALTLDMVQLEGKRPMAPAALLRGHPALAQAILGT